MTSTIEPKSLASARTPSASDGQDPADYHSPTLEIRNLRTRFITARGSFDPVDDISLSVGRNETLAIVGESGCGKSVTALSIMGLLPKGVGRVQSGNIRLMGRDLVGLGQSDLRQIRGREMSMIFQEPMTSLNPVHRVGAQVMEALRAHASVSRGEAREKVVSIFRQVGIPDAELRVEQYPHQLSGGLRQRIMIAMALICDPRLIIADEPTTALDVTIQAQILQLFKTMRTSRQVSLILITHDLGVVAETADRVVVMYAGRVVEEATVYDLFDNPQHPYTLGLLGCIPTDGPARRLASIPGSVSSPGHMPQGCRFHPRCPLADQRCKTESPPAVTIKDGHRSFCWKAPLP